MPGKVIIIEGSIGAGKTTIGKYMSNYSHVKFFTEPQNDILLKQYIDDMKKYAFTFQLFILSKRGEIYRNARRLANQGYTCIIDRSMFGDKAFAYMQFLNGNFSPAEWVIYNNIWESEIKNIEEPDITLFLDVSVDNIMKRINTRGNNDEITGYTKTYIQNLLDAYNIVLQNCQNIEKIDWNKGDSRTIYEKYIKNEK